MSRQIGYEGPCFVVYWWFVGWWAMSFGFHVDLNSPNVEIHLPFGFFRIGAQPNKKAFRNARQATKGQK